MYKVHWNINKYFHFIFFPTGKAMTSVLLPRWIRQDQSPVIFWTWRIPFSGELIFLINGQFECGLHDTWGNEHCCVIFTECDVLAGTQAPLQTPLLAHTTPPHLRTCGTQVLPTVWVRGWLYQVKTHVISGGWNAPTWNFVFRNSLSQGENTGSYIHAHALYIITGVPQPINI